MWYWCFIGVVVFLIGFWAYSAMVLARRADERANAVKYEEYSSKVQSCGSNSATEPRLNDKLEEKVCR